MVFIILRPFRIGSGRIINFGHLAYGFFYSFDRVFFLWVLKVGKRMLPFSLLVFGTERRYIDKLFFFLCTGNVTALCNRKLTCARNARSLHVSNRKICSADAFYLKKSAYMVPFIWYCVENWTWMGAFWGSRWKIADNFTKKKEKVKRNFKFKERMICLGVWLMKNH